MISRRPRNTNLQAGPVACASSPGHVLLVVATADEPTIAPYLAEIAEDAPSPFEIPDPEPRRLVGGSLLTSADLADKQQRLRGAAYLIDESHGRVRFELSGPDSRRKLSTGVAIDLAMTLSRRRFGRHVRAHRRPFDAHGRRLFRTLGWTKFCVEPVARTDGIAFRPMRRTVPRRGRARLSAAYLVQSRAVRSTDAVGDLPLETVATRAGKSSSPRNSWACIR